MAVIVLASGMGTGVKYVAEQVARRLGLELVHREIFPAGLELTSAGQGAPLLAKSSSWDAGLAWLRGARHREGLAELENLCRLVQRDNVLICGTTPLHYLSALTHVTKIRVRTTMALRVRRIMACMGADEPELALGKILQSDQRQSETLRKVFGITDLENPSLYDGVIDTGREPAETCALQIVKLATRPTATQALARSLAIEALVGQIEAVRAENGFSAVGDLGASYRAP
jgi:cytidylate kinase